MEHNWFWNISIFDKYYFNSLFEHFVFPDGTKPNWETLDKLQKYFMRWFNKEREKALLTFPVVTVAMLTDDNDIKDKEYKEFIAQEISEGNAFFTYLSKTVDSLSSCCFSKDTKILWKSSTLGVQYTTLEELYKLKWEPSKKNLRIFHNGAWVAGKPIQLPNRDMYKITTSNNKVYYMTDNHINVTYDGEKETSKLSTNDYLAFNTTCLEAIPENNDNLSYYEGFAIGSFLGDGSFSSHNGKQYGINYSLNEYNKYTKCIDMINNALINLKDNTSKVKLGSIQNNVYPVIVYSTKLAELIKKWTNWKEGTYSYNKELNLDCLLQSKEFRQGILDGWYHTDGGNSNRCYTTSTKLKDCMEILITSLGLNSIIDISDRTDEKVIIRDEEYKRNYSLWCVRWYEKCNKRTVENVYKWKNNTQYFKIRNIEKVPYTDKVYCIECSNKNEPYFTLPSGLITHNCRLQSCIEDQINDFSYSLGAGGVMTGSMNVITLNLNRFIQDCHNNIPNCTFEDICYSLSRQVKLIHKYQLGYKQLFKKLLDKNMLPAYSANFISLDKQYLTIGINGLVESAEYMGIEPNYNDKYIKYASTILKVISNTNKQTCKENPGLKLNLEFVPKPNKIMWAH